MSEYPSPPAYNQSYAGYTPTTVCQPNPQHTVVIPRGTNTMIVQRNVMRPPSYMWLSCLVYWCCNLIAGGIAFALSMASSNAADENRMDEAKRYGKASLWTSVVGVVVSVILIIVLIILYVVVWNDVNDWNDVTNTDGALTIPDTNIDGVPDMRDTYNDCLGFSWDPNCK